MNSKGEWEVPSGYTLEARVFINARKTKGIDESAVEWGQRQRFFSVADLFLDVQNINVANDFDSISFHHLARLAFQVTARPKRVGRELDAG